MQQNCEAKEKANESRCDKEGDCSIITSSEDKAKSLGILGLFYSAKSELPTISKDNHKLGDINK